MKQFETRSKKVRGMARQSLELIQAMYVAADSAHPITGRGIGYKLFYHGASGFGLHRQRALPAEMRLFGNGQ
jgi:hypothetical protein